MDTSITMGPVMQPAVQQPYVQPLATQQPEHQQYVYQQQPINVAQPMLVGGLQQQQWQPQRQQPKQQQPFAGPIADPTPYLACSNYNGANNGKWFPLNADELRYVTVKPFKDQVYVGIRQLYWEDGELRFGRTGINLRLYEWRALLQSANEIDAAVVNLEHQLVQQASQAQPHPQARNPNAKHSRR